MTDLVVADKTCAACHETKSLSEFHRDSGSRDGRCSECKVCNIARVKANQARRRQEMGDKAWLAQQTEIRRRSRQKPEVAEQQRKANAAYATALAKLRDAHRSEFDKLLDAERYERGLL